MRDDVAARRGKTAVAVRFASTTVVAARPARPGTVTAGVLGPKVPPPFPPSADAGSAAPVTGALQMTAVASADRQSDEVRMVRDNFRRETAVAVRIRT